jgi:hypothetical protein
MYTTVNLLAGGSINYSLQGFENSRINIFGGSKGGDLGLLDNSKIRIFGFDFAVDGQSTGYGEITSIYGGSYDNEPRRMLTGTLASGESIINGFQIGHDARIVLIPEPASAIILGLGGLFFVLRRRQR